MRWTVPATALSSGARSFISDPFGRVLEEAPHAGDAILIQQVEPARIEDTRRNWPFFRDRRIDAYGKLTTHPEA